MIDMSQTVDDVIEESKKKWEHFEIDKRLGDRAKELFESAKTHFDPSIYKGEYKGSGRPVNYDRKDSPVKIQERMARKSPYLGQALNNELHDIRKNLPPGRRGYNFGRDTAGGYDFKRDTAEISYNGSFEDVAQQYLMGEGKELYAHLRGKGRDFYNITRIGTADLEGAVAALATNGVEAALLGSSDFEKKISELADNYGISVDRAISYVLSHEFVHASQKGKGYDDPILAELDVEHTLKEYFTARGDSDLADVASDRAANVLRNYSGIGNYNMPKGISERGGLESYIGKGIGSGSVRGGASSEYSVGAGDYAAASLN